jgi:serine/threonine-protein kinase
MSDNQTGAPKTPVGVMGSYRLLEPLGSGGMSSVFRAVHIESGHVVALKVLPKVLARKSTLLQRFIREAKSAEALQHPNVVAIYDRGFDEGRHYLVLEFVDGKDLHDKVQDEGPVPAAQAVPIIRQAAEALRYAAARGVIHRDIKPANLLLGKDGLVKIIDLGLALQAEDEDERVTRDGTTVGTVDYMAPEQARDSRATGVRSDIYSLGCTFFYILTGSPPYPGGDIADKLRRHSSVPAPDARQYRSDVPEALSRLVRRMMAKRPERRFRDYDELIAELDSLQLVPAASSAPPVALIDDEDDLPTIGNEPPVALIDEELPDEIALMPEDGDDPLMMLSGPVAPGAPPVALIDDEDEGPAASPVGPARGPSSSGTTRTRSREPNRGPVRSAPEINMADLAALEEDTAPAPRRPRPASSQVRRVAEPAASSIEEALFEPPTPAVSPTLPGSRVDADWNSVRGWVIGGLGGAVVVILILMVLRSAMGPSPERDGGGETVDATIVPDRPPPMPRVAPTDVAKKAPGPTPGPKPSAPTPNASVAWVEPEEDKSLPAPEPEYPKDWESKLAVAPFSPPAGPVVAVRRVGPVEGRGDVVTTLRAGLDDPNAVLELADNGPFFEADLRYAGKNRLIRARTGFRPIIFIEAPAIDAVKDRPASITVAGGNLTLEGIDLVVKAGQMSQAQKAVFDVHGGLCLRDCTITMRGPANQRYSVIDVEAPGAGDIRTGKRSTIILERTLVRGAVTSIFDLNSGADVHVERSVLLADGGAIASVVGTTTGGQDLRLDLLRCLTGSSGPLVDLGTSRASSGQAGVTLRVLGSTVGRIDGGKAVAPFALREGHGTGSHSPIDVQGANTSFVGWTSWVVAGSGARLTTEIGDDSAAREAWPTFERPHLEGGPLKLASPVGQIEMAELAALTPTSRPVLDRVAVPGARLIEKTTDAYHRPVVPELAIPAPAPLPPTSINEPGPFHGQSAPSGSTGRWALPTANGPSVPGLVELTFDANAAPWKGDLALFLRETVRPDTRLVRVLAKGTGTHESGPIRLTEGTSLEVRVEAGPAPSPVGGVKVEPLTWVPKSDAQGEALFDVRQGSLALTNVHLARRATGGPGHLVRVEDGHLVLSTCALNGADGGGGRPLVIFRAASSRPLVTRPPISLPALDRPVCRIVDSLLHAGGEALTAELGRGMVALSNCVVTSEGTAFTLRPEKVRRDRFEADLWLERCTVIAGRSVVGFGKWPGADPGPDRPWLVSTKNCVFLDAFQRGNSPRQGAMLRLGDPEGLAKGAVAWQSTGDAYDVASYIVSGAAPPATRADFRPRWANVWGEAHVFSALAPSRGDTKPVVRLATDRLRPGEFLPSDLIVVAPPQMGADLQKLGIKPARKP